MHAGKLKRWLASSDCPYLLTLLRQSFDRAYGVKPTGDDISPDDVAEPPDVSSPDDLRSATKQPRVGLRARMWHNGTLYSRSSTHVGNSLVLYHVDGDESSELVPGSIKYIYRPRQSSFTFAVQRQLPVAASTLDPFRHYPDFPAKLHSSRLRDELELVKPEWVVAHFARWKMTDDHTVVLPLFRVCVVLLGLPNEGANVFLRIEPLGFVS
jgi:hypothetical protein